MTAAADKPPEPDEKPVQHKLRPDPDQPRDESLAEQLYQWSIHHER